jgi:hypothetical protein
LVDIDGEGRGREVLFNKFAIIIAVLATVVPTYAFAAHQGIDIDTLPYPKAECISGINNGACYVAEARLANGTMLVFSIDNSMLHVDDPTPAPAPAPVQTQTNDDNDDGDRDTSGDQDQTEGDQDKRTGSDCWIDGDFVGKDRCDTGGLPLCSEDDSGRCFDEADFPDED